jgi:hypothetical protein
MEKLKNFIHHFFIPHEDNNYRAKSLHTDFLTFYLIIAFAMSVIFNRAGLNVLGFATDISVDKLYQLTNEQRQKNNLNSLVLNDELSAAAQKKAQDMFVKNYWSHYSPTGSTPWDFILNSGYRYEYAGENLAKNFLFSQGVVDAWMNSPSHRDNLLKKEYTEVGFAVVNGILNGEQTTLVVQMFGKPLVSASAPLVKKEPEINTNNNNNYQAPKKIVQEQSFVLAQKTSQPKLSWLNITFNLNLVFLLFLLLALSLDFYFASKFNIIRIGGKNLAHFIFIIFILLGLLAFSKGAIL